jgi:hypothetical protein
MSSLRGGFYVSLHRKNGHKKKALFIGDGILSCSNEQVKGNFSGFSRFFLSCKDGRKVVWNLTVLRKKWPFLFGH